MNKISTIQYSDMSIAYKVYGEGDPLIMIMGYSGSMDSWPAELVHTLAKSYQVIVFDNRGIARSTASEEEFSIKLFASDVTTLMDALKIEKAHIFGFSMGVSVALQISVDFSEKVKSLILLGGSCGGEEEKAPDRYVIEGLDKILQIAITDPERFYKLFFTESWLKNNNPAKYMKPPKIVPEQQIVQRQFQALMSWPGVYDQLAGIKQPSLVMTGTQDVIRPPQNSHILANSLPAAKLVEFEGGHGCLWQYSFELANEITEFLGLL